MMRPVQTGDILAGKYLLEQVLGEGATGQVWRATQLELDRRVAVKVMHRSLADHPDAQLRFLREARVAATLHHPGAVRILDFGGSEAGMFLVMEHLVGETLRARTERAPVPRPLALDVARQIAVVLDVAHRVNLVHRDIKPENTFLCGDPGAPVVKVVDFGLAFIADAQTSLGRLTADGVLGGTPAYMSPEQARGRAVGPASDVYSLGCTLYELIAGRPPFLGSVTEIITRHAYAPAVPLRDLELEPPPPAALDDLLRTMLNKSPPLRPAASQVVAALTALLAVTDGAAATSMRLLPRASRGLGLAATIRTEDELEAPPALVLAVEGALDEDTRRALAAADIEVTTVDDGRAAAVFAPGAGLARLTELAARGVPLLTDVDAGDFAGMAARVRAGCKAAVMRPVSPDALVARVRRLPTGRRAAALAG